MLSREKINGPLEEDIMILVQFDAWKQGVWNGTYSWHSAGFLKQIYVTIAAVTKEDT